MSVPTPLSLLLDGIDLASNFVAPGYPPTRAVRAAVAAELNILNELIAVHADGGVLDVAAVRAQQARLVELIGEWTAASRGGRS